MAATPVFQGLDKLKHSLRLSSLPGGADITIQLDRAVENGRLEFWRRLGADRINILKAITPKDPPITNDEHLRMLAEHTELLLCWVYLATYLPVTVIDGSADFRELWNSDEQFKTISDGGRQARLNMVWTKIGENFELLSGEETEETTVAAATIEPNITNADKIIGNSIYRSGIQ